MQAHGSALIDNIRIIYPHKYNDTEFSALHSLSCGSYSTTTQVPAIAALSKYRIKPHFKFPINTSSDSKPPLRTILLLLQGKLNNNSIIIESPQVVVDPRNISGDEVNQAEFLRITLKQQSESISEESTGTSVRLPDEIYWTNSIVIIRKSLKTGESVSEKTKGLSWCLVYVIRGCLDSANIEPAVPTVQVGQLVYLRAEGYPLQVSENADLLFIHPR